MIKKISLDYTDPSGKKRILNEFLRSICTGKKKLFTQRELCGLWDMQKTNVSNWQRDIYDFSVDRCLWNLTALGYDIKIEIEVGATLTSPQAQPSTKLLNLKTPEVSMV